MKKIINGKMYNTETAEKLTSWEHSYRSQVDWYEEMLYKKKTGEYFLYGNGNAGSKYARETSQNCYSPDETIIPITESTAKYLHGLSQKMKKSFSYIKWKPIVKRILAKLCQSYGNHAK